MHNLCSLNFSQRANCIRYYNCIRRLKLIVFQELRVGLERFKIGSMAKSILAVVFVIGCSGLILRCILADDSRCNVSVYKTTQDLVYCVKNGIHYDKTRRPKTIIPRDDPVFVNVSIEIASLQVDTSDMDFSMEFFFRQRWHDPNLAYAEQQAGGKKFIVFKVDLVKDLWTPDTYIYGIKSIQTVQTDSAVPASEGLRISPNGDVLFSTRLSMTLSCSMTFHDFPMDKQICFLNITSFFYTDEDLHYEWGELTVLDENIAHFVLMSYEKSVTVQEFTSGKYGRLTITFEFNRRINFYLLSWYLPATLIVALSWVGFWIDTKATPARISLGTITILASGSFLIGEQDGFPSVSYIRAIDIYLITCFVFVFGCMVEYAIVHYSKRLMENREHHKKNDTEAVKESVPSNPRPEAKTLVNGVVNAGFMDILTPWNSQDFLQWTNFLPTTETMNNTAEINKKPSFLKSHKPRFRERFVVCWATKLDEICRLTFPLTFLVLSIAYWVVFLFR